MATATVAYRLSTVRERESKIEKEMEKKTTKNYKKEEET